jgi:dipeptidyl-peptidase-4
VYGGPGVQYVCDSWIGTADMRAQYLRSQGILVWKVSIFNLDILTVYVI